MIAIEHDNRQSRTMPDGPLLLADQDLFEDTPVKKPRPLVMAGLMDKRLLELALPDDALDGGHHAQRCPLRTPLQLHALADMAYAAIPGHDPVIEGIGAIAGSGLAQERF